MLALEDAAAIADFAGVIGSKPWTGGEIWLGDRLIWSESAVVGITPGWGLGSATAFIYRVGLMIDGDLIA